MIDVPTDYGNGAAKAREVDAALADRYLAHTRIGDPAADAAIEALAAHPRDRQQHWIAAGIESGAADIADAPAALRDFFAAELATPDWFDPVAAWPGCRAFHAHSRMFVAAFVGAVLIEGFATGISRSFAITGRITDQGVRRLQQNNRHLLEIFLPGGLSAEGEGRRLSIRIRLVHARVRRLLWESDEWDQAAWGVPLSAAHIGFATAAFSGLLLERAAMLGVRLTDAERASFMLVWRRAGALMGAPDALLCHTQEEAMALLRIGRLCEPPPDIDSIMMANALINSAPLLLGIDAPVRRKALVKRIYGVSRQMIGAPLADSLRFPAAGGAGALMAIRLQNRAEAWLGRLLPGFAARRRQAQFQQMMGLSFAEKGAIDYRMPGALHAERDRPG